MSYRLVLSPGDRYNMLTFVEDRPHEGGERMALWRCDCGNEKVQRVNNVRRGASKSCGCLWKTNGGKNRTHGMSNTVLYRRWTDMHRRCRTSPWYAHVSVDPRWDTFEGFLEHPPQGEFEEHLTLGRIDHDLAYSPENCLWQTRSDNSSEASNRAWTIECPNCAHSFRWGR